MFARSNVHTVASGPGTQTVRRKLMTCPKGLISHGAQTTLHALPVQSV